MLEFRVLGPVEVLRDGEPVDLGRRRERVLLGALVLAANRVVPAERLISDLWGENPPPAAASALRVHISRLRRALGDDVLTTRPGGYVLCAGPDVVDAAAFDRLVADGRLREALALWRGPAYADVAHLPFAAGEIARLEEARLTALEDRIGADLACGSHRALVGELEALTGEHPLRERLWELRMLALYRSGRQADALAAFQALRRHLDAELGLTPGSAVRALEGAILRQDPALDTPARSAAAADPGPTLSTILVTDVVGSTAQRSSLGERRADGVRREHDKLLGKIIRERGGQVLKGSGDGLLAAFSAASDALTAAVEIQRAIEADNHRSAAPTRLAVRIGLSGGDVSWDGVDCFGTPVVEAAQLEAHAESGQILCSDFVRIMARGRGGHRFRPLGELMLEGLPEPIETCAVEWRPAEASPAAPMPTVLARTGRIFVGRDADLVRLRELWAQAATGRQRQLVLIGGEPGVGKTRLAAEFAAAVQGEALVLAGRCDEDLAVPYQPFVEALRHHLGQPGPELGQYAGELVRLAPELTRAMPGLPPPLRGDPQTEQYRLFDAVAAWLVEASIRRPVLLVLDDLHWAAKPTLLMLRHILRYADDLRLMILVTFRDTDIGAADAFTAWAADLRRERGVERIPLRGLDQVGVTAFVEAAGNAADVAELAGAVWAETDGNPFFVAEVLRNLTETGAVRQEGERWVTTAPTGELGIPDSVRDVVGRRLSRLSADTNLVLSIAAIAGAEFDPSVVRVACGLGEDVVFDALDEAVAARLLAESPRGYRFAHALVRKTVTDRIGSARRLAVHSRLLGAMEDLYGDRLEDHLPALAQHSAQAASPKAVDYAARAGHQAAKQYAHDQAAAYYAQALELLEQAEDPRRPGLMVSLGEAQRRAGDPRHRDTLLGASREAATRGDAVTQALAALANARGPYSSGWGVDDERLAALEDALAALPARELSLRARLLATIGVELHWHPDSRRRAEYSDQAVAAARRSGDPATLAEVLLKRPQTLVSPSTLPERLAATAELVDLPVIQEDQALRAWAHCVRHRTLMEVPDFRAAERHYEAFAAAAEGLGQPVLRWVLGCTRVGRATAAGRLDEAEAEMAAATTIGAGQNDAEAYYLCQRFCIMFHRGVLAEVVDFRRDTTFIPFEDLIARYPSANGWLAAHCAEIGDLDQARRWVGAGARVGFEIPLDQAWITAMTWYASAVVALGDTDSAAAIRDLLSPYRTQLATSGALTTGAVAHWLALLARTLGRQEEADAQFAAAAATHEQVASPPWLARTQLEWGEMLLTSGRSGDASRGRDLLRHALTTARAYGLHTIDRRTSALLA